MTKSLLLLLAGLCCSAIIVRGSHNFQCPMTRRRLDSIQTTKKEGGGQQKPPKLDGEQYRRRAKRQRRHNRGGGSTQKSSRKKFFETHKSTKSKSSTCRSGDDDERLKCGAVFEGLDVRITLLGDLDCSGQFMKDGAAITLKDGAVLDCDGHTIHGGGDDEPFNVTGVQLMGDAKIVNCEIAEFHIGIHIENDANMVSGATVYGNVNGGIKVENDGCNTIEETDTVSNNGPGIDASGTGILLLSDVYSISNFGVQTATLGKVPGLRIETKDATSTIRRHLLDKLEINPSASLTVIVDDATFSWNDGNGVATSGDGKLDLHLFGEIAVIGNSGDGMTLSATDGSMTTFHEQNVISRNFNAGINLAADSKVLFGEYSQTSICDQDVDDIDGEGSFKLEYDGVVLCSTSNATNVDGFSCDSQVCQNNAEAGVEVCIK